MNLIVCIYFFLMFEARLILSFKSLSSKFFLALSIVYFKTFLSITAWSLKALILFSKPSLRLLLYCLSISFRLPSISLIRFELAFTWDFDRGSTFLSGWISGSSGILFRDDFY